MKLIKGYKVHWVFASGDALLSKSRDIYKYSHMANNLELICQLDYSKSIQNIINKGLFERVLRGGIHHILSINDHILTFFDRSIFLIKLNKIEKVFNITTCKRPLNVCINPINNHIYWGDYNASRNRYPVNIYRSTNYGRDWEIVYTFPTGQVRHVHNIIYDDYRGCYWILTGDNDSESGIWKTRDWKTLVPFLQGSQKYRATSIIPLENQLVIPTDTEYEHNYIQLYSFKNERIDIIYNLPNSAIGAKMINNISFVSTMYEKSPINKKKFITLNCSINNKDWYILTSQKKDHLSPKYFQYPSIKIPEYENNYSGDIFYFNAFGTRDFNGVIIYSKKDITSATMKS